MRSRQEKTGARAPAFYHLAVQAVLRRRLMMQKSQTLTPALISHLAIHAIHAIRQH